VVPGGPGPEEQKLTPESATAAEGEPDDLALVSSAASVGEEQASGDDTSPRSTPN